MMKRTLQAKQTTLIRITIAEKRGKSSKKR